jgi:hypothetical protein
VLGYFDHLAAFLDTVHLEQFVDSEHRAMVMMEEDPNSLLTRFASYRHPTSDKAAWTLRLDRGITQD